MAVRASSILMLHQPMPDLNPALAEHRRRLWWTTFLLDNATSAEIGVRPTLRFAEAEHSFPSDAALPSTEKHDFADAQLQTINIELCNVRNSILDVSTRLRQGDFANFRYITRYPIDLLTTWRSNVPSRYSFDFATGIPIQMQSLPSMRSLASVYLRYHQAYILLIRPLYIKLLAVALGKDEDNLAVGSLTELADCCLGAAKHNISILLDLARLQKLAQYGFWESLHLFSAISILALARMVSSLRPSHLALPDEENSFYYPAEALLQSMADRGNVASKGHLRLVREINELSATVLDQQSGNQAGGMPGTADLEQDIFQWIESIGNLDHYEF
jgi:proline utilization trans-activator